MDMSFAVQALTAEYALKHKDELEAKFYEVPAELDTEIAQTKLDALGVRIDALSDVQKEYLESWH
jgi:adenosylhomocysteinase